MMSDDWYTKEQLHFAAQDGDLAKVKMLVESGYDVNAFDDAMFYTPLHYAALGEHVEVIRYLLSAGADINAHHSASAGETPLGAVAQTCSVEIARVLMAAGANPLIPGWMQISALHRASKRKKPEGRRVYELLLRAAQERFHYKA